MKRLIAFLPLFLCFSSCFNQQDAKSKAHYDKMRSMFDKKISDHFPEYATTIHTLISSLNTDKQTCGLVLYNYNVNSKQLEEAQAKIKASSVVNYHPKDDCLLVINRFETFETSENDQIVTNFDTSVVNRACYKDKYPIPNFIDIDNPSKKSPTQLNDSYTIYVLEAKAGRFYTELQLRKNPQMPDNWKQGYSKGIAISEKEKTIIYWGLIW